MATTEQAVAACQACSLRLRLAKAMHLLLLAEGAEDGMIVLVVVEEVPMVVMVRAVQSLSHVVEVEARAVQEDQRG